MSYKDYLKSQHWNKTKKRFVNKPSHKYCYVCLSEDNLHVHHKSYKNKNGDSILGNEYGGQLVRLCSDCHNLWHKYYGLDDFCSLKKLRKICSLISSGMGKEESFRISSVRKEYISTVNDLSANGKWKPIRGMHRSLGYVKQNANHTN